MRLLAFVAVLIPVTAAGRLGGIDMNRACRDQYGGGWVAYVQNSGCSGWKCVPGPGNGEATPRGVDTPRACGNQYGSGAYALCYSGEYDWSCFRD